MQPVPLTPQDSKLALLQLPPSIDGPANAWLDKLMAADGYLAARRLRDGCHTFTNELRQQQRITHDDAVWMRLTIDHQWSKRIDALDALGAPVIEVNQ